MTGDRWPEVDCLLAARRSSVTLTLVRRFSTKRAPATTDFAARSSRSSPPRPPEMPCSPRPRFQNWPRRRSPRGKDGTHRALQSDSSRPAPAWDPTKSTPDRARRDGPGVPRARHPAGGEVAVKVLPSEVAADPERLRHFQLEARAVAALNHPNILAIYDVGVSAAPLLADRSRRDGLPPRALPGDGTVRRPDRPRAAGQGRAAGVGGARIAVEMAGALGGRTARASSTAT